MSCLATGIGLDRSGPVSRRGSHTDDCHITARPKCGGGGRLGSALLVFACLATAITLMLWLTGGFRYRPIGLRVSASNLDRPAIVAVILWTALAAKWPSTIPRLRPRSIVLAAVCLTGLFMARYAAPFAAGADMYGYVAQAGDWRAGALRHAVSPPAPASFPEHSYVPLGYVWQHPPPSAVALYPPGTPLHMAVASLVTPAAMYVVAPLAALLAIVGTYGLGLVYFSEHTGVWAAVLLGVFAAIVDAGTRADGRHVGDGLLGLGTRVRGFRFRADAGTCRRASVGGHRGATQSCSALRGCHGVQRQCRGPACNCHGRHRRSPLRSPGWGGTDRAVRCPTGHRLRTNVRAFRLGILSGERSPVWHVDGPNPHAGSRHRRGGILGRRTPPPRTWARRPHPLRGNDVPGIPVVSAVAELDLLSLPVARATGRASDDRGGAAKVSRVSRGRSVRGGDDARLAAALRSELGRPQRRRGDVTIQGAR